MKKHGLIGALVLALPVLAVASPAGFSLRVEGGPSYFTLSDLNDVFSGWDSYIREISLETGGGLNSIHLGAEALLEAVYSFTPRIGIGLAVGYGCVQKQASTHREYQGYEGIVRVDETFTPKVRSLPLLLTAYYTLALNPKWDVVLGAGLGYYAINFDFEKDSSEFRPAGDGTYDYSFSSSRRTVGFHASAAVEMNVSSLLSLFASIRFRMAGASDFVGTKEGSWTWSGGTGGVTEDDLTFWIYTYNYGGSGYTMHTFSATEPSGATYSNARKGRIDLTGAALNFGARIIF
jgi:hypothetical protein